MIDKALDKYVPSGRTYPPEIHRAMRYSLFPGGKRFRAILTIASCETASGSTQQVMPSACAMELIHTYSLIHDDLPAIDNDDYRRGKLSTHRKFGEAIAILTGDALLTQAFLLLTQNAKKSRTSDRRVLGIIYEVADAIGSLGMIGGQIVDIRRSQQIKEIEYIHTHKTAALIKVSVRIGAILAGANSLELRKLTEYGRNIGLAFQIADDILDAECGKCEPNYVHTFGKAASLEKTKDLIRKANRKLISFGKKSEILQGIANSIYTFPDIGSIT